MSWIQENKFVAGLGVVTLLGVAGLGYWGNSSKQKALEAQMRFETAKAEIARYESGALYPSDANRDLKRKAVMDYGEQAATLRDRMTKFRPQEITNIAANAFTDELQAAKGRVSAAFAEAQTELPENFLLGFESYMASVAQGESTGMLSYQLDGVESLLMDLAKARPEAVLNVYRKALPEEQGRVHEYGKEDVARDLPIELTFSGTARSLREFMSALVNSPNHYFILRAIRVENEKPAGPSRNDAKFETPMQASSTDTGFDFAGFTLPTVDPAPAGGVAVLPGREDGAEAGVATEQVLKQILGDEQIKVFMRIDMRFFRDAPSVPLPEPLARP